MPHRGAVSHRPPAIASPRTARLKLACNPPAWSLFALPLLGLIAFRLQWQLRIKPRGNGSAGSARHSSFRTFRTLEDCGIRGYDALVVWKWIGSLKLILSGVRQED